MGGAIRYSPVQVTADSFNQHTSNSTGARMIGRHVLDCLTYVAPATGEVQPWLATSWEVSADATTFTMELREDVMFHDGTPFNADAVKANFEYTMNPDIPHGFRYGAIGGDAFESANAVDAFTVELIYNAPVGTLLPSLSDGGAGIDSPTALEQYGDDYGVTALVGSGPFKFVEWVPKTSVTMEKNPDYNWGPTDIGHAGEAFLDTLQYLEIAEAATRAAALESGDIDAAQMVASQAAQFEGNSDVEIVLVPSVGTSRMIAFNMHKAPLDDIRVRKAINHAIDKEALIQLPAWAGIGRPGVAPLQANMFPNGDVTRLMPFDYAYDPDLAGELLDEAGWTMGSNGMRSKDGEELVLDFVTYTSSLPNIEPLDGLLNQVGISLNILPGDFAYYLDTTEKGEYQLTLNSDSGFNSAGQIEEYFHTNGVYNHGGMELLDDAPAIDAAIDKALTTADDNERWEQLFVAMELIMKNAVMAVGWETDYVFGVRSNVKNLTFNEVGYPYFYDASNES